MFHILCIVLGVMFSSCVCFYIYLSFFSCVFIVDVLNLTIILMEYVVGECLDDPDVFVYTSQGGCPTVESIDDDEDFCNVIEALTLIGNVLYTCHLIHIMYQSAGS